MNKYVTTQGDTADFIAWKQYGTQSGGVVERLLDANPGLSDMGVVLPAGIVVYLPEIETAGVSPGVKLWS